MSLLIAAASFLHRQDLRVSLAVLATVLALGPALVLANGRATLISSQEAGPYRIDVSILPARPVVANTHLSVLVWSRSSDQIITDAAVHVSAAGPEGATDFGPIPAANDFAPQFFEADLPFDIEGPWEVAIQVSSGMGQETIIVLMDVREGGGLVNWILLAAVAVAILTVGIWTWDRVTGRRAETAPEE